MRKLSIKLKITLWFTASMIVLSLIAFLFVSLVSDSVSTRWDKDALINMVDANVKEVEYIDGEYKIGNNFAIYKNGIYCLVLDDRGNRISGRIPVSELKDQDFADGQVRTVIVDGDIYLIYDKRVSNKFGDIWLRGTVCENVIANSALYYSIFASMPLLLTLTAVGGYRIARRSLRPMEKITHIAEEIGNSGDLSKRIPVEENGNELHQLAGTFNQMFDRLENNFEAEKQFISDASHELRTPVTTILAQCEYAIENASGEEELYEAIGNIQRQGYRMSRVIESLLNYTRLEQRTETVNFETIDLSELISSICKEQKEIPEKGIRLTDAIQPQIWMKADPILIIRMTENLIRNAYRYGVENGRISVSLIKTEEEIILSVSDDGIGIPQEELPKIWNRFYRVDKSRNYNEGVGLGLGLSMVKQIVQLHGGEIKVESTPEIGSTFTIQFRNS